MPKNQRSDYTANSITVLEGLEPVRKRPGMYIGSTGPEGLHHLVWEVVDNSIDEAMAGFCKHIVVTLQADGSVRVQDDGRGIPVDMNKQYKKSGLELALTKLHAGGKFDHNTYKVSGGLHGVGISVVNALSKSLVAEVYRDGGVWTQEYSEGIAKTKLKRIGNTKKNGTVITFKPDPTIFTETEFSWDIIIAHLRQQSYLTHGILMRIEDFRTKGEEKRYGFMFEGGVASYVRHLNLHKVAQQPTPFYVSKQAPEAHVEISFQYTDEYKEHILAFANNIYNPEGGSHVAGFRTALTRSLNQYARSKNYLKEKDENLTGDDVREGLTAVISVKVANPQFEGQTKSKLGNPEVRTAVESVFGEALAMFLEEQPKAAESIIEKCLLTSRARLAAKAARETVLRKGVLEGLTLPGKLADCTSRDPQFSELYIVEGDSAGGSAKQGRNRHFQAVLPLRGKILNVERARIDKILANNEIKNLIIALGTNIGEQFDITQLRYHRVIIMTDADVDGAHIRTLLLTLFWRYFPAVITSGHLYIAHPPLYRLSRGKDVRYAYTEEEKLALLVELQHSKKSKAVESTTEDAEETATPVNIDEGATNVGGVTIQRYKGLGEMNPEQLWNTTMDPEHRMMMLVNIEDAEKADEMFDVLMGAEVAPRKHFIQVHAKTVKNLDI